jgi:hypothetical protein
MAIGRYHVDGIAVPNGRCYVYKGWYYYYSTTRAENALYEDRPYVAWVEKPPFKREIEGYYKMVRKAQRGEIETYQVPEYPRRKLVKSRWFARRKSAHNAAARWAAAHENRILIQKRLRESGYISPNQTCTKCWAKRRLKDSNICKDCRDAIGGE